MISLNADVDRKNVKNIDPDPESEIQNAALYDNILNHVSPFKIVSILFLVKLTRKNYVKKEHSTTFRN
jgi:hypothetical protein